MDTTCCPLCGESNNCGMSAGKASCWCFSAVIAPHVIERIPSDRRGVACVCAKCAAEPAPPPTDRETVVPREPA